MIDPAEGGCVVSVRVVPGASQAGVVGRYGDEVRIRLTSPPEDGRANAEMCALVARLVGVRPALVEVVVGATSRSKRLFVPVPAGTVLDALRIGRSDADDR